MRLECAAAAPLAVLATADCRWAMCLRVCGAVHLSKIRRARLATCVRVCGHMHMCNKPRARMAICIHVSGHVHMSYAPRAHGSMRLHVRSCTYANTQSHHLERERLGAHERHAGARLPICIPVCGPHSTYGYPSAGARAFRCACPYAVPVGLMYVSSAPRSSRGTCGPCTRRRCWTMRRS